MAKPPRQSGRSVTFTPASAKRIARAVLASERGGRDMERTQLRTAGNDDALVRGTFSGDWAKDGTATVTDKVLTSVTYTGVKNYLTAITGTGTKDCLIAYVGGEWVLVAVAPQGVVRGTFTAPWNKGATTTVTDAVTSSTTYTDVKNYFAAITGTGTKACAIAYVGAEWILIAAECS